MQIKSLRYKSYRSIKIDEREISAVALYRRRKLDVYFSQEEGGCSENAAFRAIEVSRATIYRWNALYRAHGIHGLSPKSTRPSVVRQPCWNKHIQRAKYFSYVESTHCGVRRPYGLYCGDNDLKVSVSTVGRILKKLIKPRRVKPGSYYYGHLPQAS